MKDFSEWLDELTGELQEDDATLGPQEVQTEDTFDGGMWAEDMAKRLYGRPGYINKPLCGICECPEDVCECEEAEYAQQHENTELWTAAAREFCKQVASSYGLTADIMAKQARAADMELSVKILDRYRRNPYQWMESDENE